MKLKSDSQAAALWAALLSLVVSLQLLVGLGYIFSFFPRHLVIDAIYPAVFYFQHPPRSTFCYRFFVAVFLTLYALFYSCSIKKISIFQDTHRVRTIVIMDGIILVCMLTALIQAVRFSYSPWLAQGALRVFLAAGVASKMFWPWAEKISAGIKVFLLSLTLSAKAENILTTFFALLIASIVFVPDIDALTAHATMTGEGQRQNNFMVTAQAYAYLMGDIPYVDVISRYGIGLPIIFGRMTGILGPCTYENMTCLVMWITIFYYILWFFLIRRWLGNVVWAAAVVLLIMNLTVFGREGGPILFYITYNATPVRFMFDIVFFWLIYIHVSRRKSWALAAAGTVVGLDIFYIVTSGVCLAAAFGAYLLLLALLPNCRKEYLKTANDWFLWGAAFILMPLIFFTLTFMAAGVHILTASFWHNFFMQLRYWNSGSWQAPFSQLLANRDGTLQWFVLLVGLFLFSLIAAVTLLFTEVKAAPNLIWISIFAVYGLADLQHMVMVGSGEGIFRNATITIMILSFWADLFLKRYSQATRGKVYWTFLFLVVYFLVINHHFIAYPNIFNFSRNPNIDPLVDDIVPGQGMFMNNVSLNFPEQLKLPLNSLSEYDENLRTEKDFSSDGELIKYYYREYTFAKDVALIRSLTSKEQRVPVISSQEVLFLMQAQRKPFFYTFPLFVSRPIKVRTFPTDEIWTQEALSGAIAQLNHDRPKYVFVQKIFLNTVLPRYYYFQYYAVIQLMNYVWQYYEPYREGEYLMAMKRKDQ